MSSFSGIQSALSGLRAHQKAMEVIGHNVANSATEGYNRRRVELGSVGSGTVPALFSKQPTGGNGVDVTSLVRVRDQYLENRVFTEVASHGARRAEAQALAQIELALPEPSDAGLAEQFGDFWAAWNDVANQPPWPANRAALLEQASTLADALHRAAGSIVQGHHDLSGQLEATLGEANAAAVRVAELNVAVRSATVAGLDASDLADQRDVLVGRLAALVGGTTRAGEDGTLDVFVGGSALVRGGTAQRLAAHDDGPTNPAVGLVRTGVAWEPGGAEAAVSSGELAGLLTGVNDIVPRYLAMLDGVAAALVGTVNAAHTTGHNLAGTETGLTFFDPAGVTAATVALSADVAGKPEQIAAGVPTTPGSGTLDGSIAQAIAQLAGVAGSADDRYHALIGSLGVEAQSANRRLDMQQIVTEQVQAERLSVSGVSLDEELAGLVSAQHAYNASARVLTAVDEMMDVLLSRTGVVGR